MDEHITNTTRIIDEKVGEAVSKTDTSNVAIRRVDTDCENDFENIDIQKKMTIGPRKPPNNNKTNDPILNLTPENITQHSGIE